MSRDTSPPVRRKPVFPLLAAGALLAAIGAGWAIGKFRIPGTNPPTEARTLDNALARGELLYQVNCANCHGPEGRGDGTVAATLRPPPRDFAARPWRFEPTKESIGRVIRDGIPGSAMPASHPALADGDMAALVEHVHRLATARPPVVYQPPLEEQLLRDAGFVDLRGIDPPAFRMTDARGQTVKLADLKGRLVLINFWGTTCEHCLKETPKLRQLETAWADRPFTVLHVCADADDARQAQRVLDQFAAGAQALVDETGLGLARFDVHVLPAVWLIDPAGKAIGKSHGAKDWSAPVSGRLLEHFLPAAKADPARGARHP